MKTLEFYFDFISPYAFFASRWIQEFCNEHGVRCEPVPVAFGALLSHWGQLGPAEIVPKRAHTFRDCASYARRNNIPLTAPASHPFLSIPALRCVVAQEGDDRWTAIHALYDAAWIHGDEISDPHRIAEHLGAAGLSVEKTLAAVQTQSVKDALKETSIRAIETGVFGVPSFVIDGVVFWGNDQRENIADYILHGEQDSERIERLMNIPAGVTRKR